MRFLADMGISPKTVALLRGLGDDTAHLHDQGLERLQDAAILDKARIEGRVLLTHDLDFDELTPNHHGSPRLTPTGSHHQRDRGEDPCASSSIDARQIKHGSAGSH